MSSKTVIQTSKGNEMTTEEMYKKWIDGDLNISYTPGMQSDRASEALTDSLPKGQNTPQKCPYGLYAEQVSGTSFTTPRKDNMRNYIYRILPSVKHTPFELINDTSLQNNIVNDFSQSIISPKQYRWNPLPIPNHPTKFYQGWRTYCGAGSVEAKSGMAIHLYVCNKSMMNESMCNADGDLLIVPQQGTLLIRTENGVMEVPSGYICVIQRGIHFSVMIKENEKCRGYIAEVFESHFVIPDLGPIGANGLANPRDFETVVACFENKSIDNKFNVIHKFGGKLFNATRPSSIFDVVAWHGNYVPFRYDLRRFCAINSVTFDHIDPSIFTVLTAQTPRYGVAVCDFVIFPPRWSVHTNTFRPPYYHRNCMSEFMGNICGIYEAKRKGFLPGGGSMHSCFSPHGPDAQTFEIASNEQQKPVPPKQDAMAFMFESCYMFKFTNITQDPSLVQTDYNDCWKPLKKHFKYQSKL